MNSESVTFTGLRYLDSTVGVFLLHETQYIWEMLFGSNTHYIPLSSAYPLSIRRKTHKLPRQVSVAQQRRAVIN